MNLLDLYEGREPYQQAIDRLEQRRIKDLEARMDDCARRGDKEGFQKCKAERDSYYKVNTNEGSMKRQMEADAERMSREQFCDTYGDEHGEFWDNINLDESTIGQDIVNKTEKMARATPQSRAGAVASTVKNAAKWLAGKGGPGREGPTYEGAEDIADRGEYDREGDMAKDNIHTIVRNAQELESVISDNDNLPEWVQDKLANIKGMMTAVSDYMQTQHERDREEGVAIAEKLKGLPTKKLGSARDSGKSVRKFRAQRGLEEAGTDSQWSKESDWKSIPKSKSGKPVDPRGEVTHLSDVARREAERKAERKADQKKNSEKVNEYISMGSDKNYMEAEPYKNYKIYVRKKPFGNTGIYTAHTEVDRKEFMGKGSSQEEAVQAIRDRIDFVLNAQKKVTGSSTIDFNVKFATDLLADPRQTFYAKLENVKGQPKLIIAGTDIVNDPELLAAGDFKRSALRNQVDDQGRATPLPGIPLTAKSLRAGDWIANGRYTVGNESTDSDGNRVFDLTYHSTAHTKSDKLRLNQPAFTLGTAREVAEEGSRPRDLGAEVMLKKARAAFPIAGNDAEALALYIADKEQRDVNRLERENDEEDALIARIMDQLKKTAVDEASWGGSGPAGLKTPYAVYTKQNGQVKRVKTTNKIGKPMNTREAEAYVAAMRKRDPARWTHDTAWVAPADIDLDEATNPAQQAAIAIAMKRAGKKPKTAKEGMFSTLGEDQDTSGVESAIIRRIMVAHKDLLMKFGPQKVMQAAEEVAYNVGDVDEIGTSDVSAYVNQVKQILGAVE
jgi:hypothetical protein